MKLIILSLLLSIAIFHFKNGITFVLVIVEILFVTVLLARRTHVSVFDKIGSIIC